MCYVKAYYDVTDNFMTIYNVLEMALSSMIYIINNVIMSQCIFPLFFILTLISNIQLQFQT